jgi:hypothetical protein
MQLIPDCLSTFFSTNKCKDFIKDINCEKKGEKKNKSSLYFIIKLNGILNYAEILETFWKFYRFEILSEFWTFA